MNQELSFTVMTKDIQKALGMAIKAMELGPDGAIVRNITLFAVLIYELFGPLMTRQALMSAGEIQPIEQHVKDRRQLKLEEAKKSKNS